jgi:hypothetical protein
MLGGVRRQFVKASNQIRMTENKQSRVRGLTGRREIEQHSDQEHHSTHLRVLSGQVSTQLSQGRFA